MLFHLLYPLYPSLTMLNVLRYPSFRMAMATLTAGVLTLCLYPAMIRWLRHLSFGQEVRDDGPQSHLVKQGTPTMGGLLLVLCVVVSCLLWGDLTNAGLWILIYVLCGFGFIGFLDDFKKIRKSNAKGWSPKAKLIGQTFVAFTAVILYSLNFSTFSFSSGLSIPFVSIDKFFWQLPLWLYVPFATFIVVGTSNAVNLTDGLDGLAIGPVINSAVVLLVLAYVAGTVIGEFNLAHYLKIPAVHGASELTIFAGAIIGASIGFLWFNAYPAAIFMGDVGSLSLGAALAMLAVLTKNELLSAILHGLFLVEALSVMAQVFSFKMYKKRIFKMAPLHHHFELLGWAEPKIIVRFWIVSGVLALISLLSLKVR